MVGRRWLSNAPLGFFPEDRKAFSQSSILNHERLSIVLATLYREPSWWATSTFRVRRGTQRENACAYRSRGDREIDLERGRTKPNMSQHLASRLHSPLKPAKASESLTASRFKFRRGDRFDLAAAKHVESGAGRNSFSRPEHYWYAEGEVNKICAVFMGFEAAHSTVSTPAPLSETR